MDKELKIKKCNNCGATIKEIVPCNCSDCGIICCNEKMTTVIANSSDGAKEKHLPEIFVNDDSVFVKVNHVMDEDHYIEWICLINDEVEEYHYFKPGDVAEVTFNYNNGIVYAYCNKHGLWKTEIK